MQAGATVSIAVLCLQDIVVPSASWDQYRFVVRPPIEGEANLARAAGVLPSEHGGHHIHHHQHVQPEEHMRGNAVPARLLAEDGDHTAVVPAVLPTLSRPERFPCTCDAVQVSPIADCTCMASREAILSQGPSRMQDVICNLIFSTS